MKAVVLGVGNTLVRDDGVGIYVSRILKKSLQNSNVEFSETCFSGLTYIDLLEGYDIAFIIDSIKLDNEPVGEVFKLDDESQDTIPESLHSFTVRNAIAVGKKAGFKMPDKAVIYAVNVFDNTGFSETVSPGIQNALPIISCYIKNDIKKHLQFNCDIYSFG